jgi:hypothetical protein
MTTENKESGKRIWIILVFILLTSNLITIYLWKTSETKQNTIIHEKELVMQNNEIDIDRMKEELEVYKGKNESLDSLVAVAEAELDKKAKEIAGLKKGSKSNKKLIDQLKKENAKLLVFRQQYLAQIDSLVSANKILIAENTDLKTNLKSEKERTETLSEEKQRLANKVAAGAILKADSIVAEGIKVKSSGRESSTSRASRTDRIKVCFRILENRVAEKGSKDIYVKIIGPEGTTLYVEEAGSGKLTIDGTESLYSTKQNIDYNNEDTRLCAYFTKGSEYSDGTYRVEIFADGYKIGSSSFTLK